MAETLTAEAAKARVAMHYATLFSDLFIADPRGGDPIPLTRIPQEDFEVSSVTDTVFNIVHDPLTGVVVVASVDRTSGLVEFSSLTLAVE